MDHPAGEVEFRRAYRARAEGVAEIVDGPVRVSGRVLNIAREMAVRYMGRDGPRYLGATADRPRYLVSGTRGMCKGGAAAFCFAVCCG